jgi:3D (Asp-Asp-Asp) domain-containing protein/peptidoglycan hydrolase CwlO-like protein
VRALADTPAARAAAVLAALGALAWLAAAPAVGAPGAGEDLSRLARAERSASLELFAAEASLAGARTRLTALEQRAARLAEDERRIARDGTRVRRSLAVTQRRVARIVRALYVEGERGDPLAILLGAESLDAVIEGLDGLARAAREQRRLTDQLARRQQALEASLLAVRAVRSDAEAARRSAASAAADIESAVAARRLTLDRIRARGAAVRERLAAIEAEAQRAQRAAAELTRAARAEEPGEPGPAADEDAAAGDEAAVAVGQPSPPPPDGGSRTLVVDAVAYHLPGRTASGLPVGVGVIAVDPAVIPLGTRVFVPGYGPAVAADVGSAIKGAIIDLWMPSTAQALAWGRRTVTITIYG